MRAGTGRWSSPVMRKRSSPLSPKASWAKNTPEKRRHNRRRHLGRREGSRSRPARKAAYPESTSSSSQPPPSQKRSRRRPGRVYHHLHYPKNHRSEKEGGDRNDPAARAFRGGGRR